MKTAHIARTGIVYRFESFELIVDRRLLQRAGVEVPVRPLGIRLLLFLIAERPRLFSEQELRQHVLGRAVGGDIRGLALHLRKALQDEGPPWRWIGSRAGLGYWFAGAVEETSDEPADADVGRLAARDASRERPIGRETELAHLRAALQRSARGEGHSALVTGPSGIGKTLLLHELADEALRLGFEVHVGRTCSDAGVPTFWPWIQLLRSWVELREPNAVETVLARRAADLHPLLAGWMHELEARDAVAERRADVARFRMFDSVACLLRRSAQTKPLLLVFDDLQRADADSLKLLSFVGQSLTSARVMILAATALEHRDARIERTFCEPGFEIVRIGGLERPAVATVLECFLDHPPSAELVTRVARLSGGNPLFIHEIARSLGSHGELDEAGLTDGSLPRRVTDHALRVISRGSDISQRVLTALAVAATPGTVPLLRRTLALDGPSILGALSECVDRQILRPVNDTFEFAQESYRYALYQRASLLERAQLHLAVGESLEALFEENERNDSLLAYHFSEAAALSSPDRAVHYARRAAERARALLGTAEAAGHLRRALKAAHLLDPSQPKLRCQLLVELGETMMLGHAALDEVHKVFLDAAGLASGLREPTLLIRSLERCTHYTHTKSAFLQFPSPALQPLLEQLREMLEAALSDGVELCATARAEALIALALLRSASGAVDSAKSSITSAVRAATEAGDEVLLAQTRLHASEIGNALDVVDERRVRCVELIALGRSSERKDLEVRARATQLYLSIERGVREERDLNVERLVGIAADGLPEGVFTLALWRSLCAQLEGRLADAELEAEEARRVGARVSFAPPRLAAIAAIQSWWLALLGGRASEATAQWEAAAALHPTLAIIRLALARLYAELGHLGEASREVRPIDASFLARQPRNDSWLFQATLRAELCALMGDREQAPALLELLRPYADRTATLGSIVICTGPVARPLAGLAATAGRWHEAEALLELAASRAASLRSQTLTAWVARDRERMWGNRPDHEPGTHGSREFTSVPASSKSWLRRRSVIRPERGSL